MVTRDRYIYSIRSGCWLWIFLAALVTFSCGGPTRKLNKAKRLIAEAVAAGAIVTNDTVYIEKEIIIPSVHHDTVVNVQTFRDTVTIETERIKTRLKVDTVTNTIFIEQEVKPDTVTIEVPTAINKDISAGFNWWHLILSFIIGSVLGLGIAAILIKKS